MFGLGLDGLRGQSRYRNRATSLRNGGRGRSEWRGSRGAMSELVTDITHMRLRFILLLIIGLGINRLFRNI
jgi:hypothetical protein